MPLDVGDIAGNIHEALDYVERTVPGADTNKRARLAWAYLAGSLRSRGNFGDRRARDLAHRISKFFALERAAAASQGARDGEQAATRDTPRVEIAQYVVEGTRSISAAISAIKKF